MNNNWMRNGNRGGSRGRRRGMVFSIALWFFGSSSTVSTSNRKDWFIITVVSALVWLVGTKIKDWLRLFWWLLDWLRGRLWGWLWSRLWNWLCCWLWSLLFIFVIICSFFAFLWWSRKWWWCLVWLLNWFLGPVNNVSCSNYVSSGWI